ncbi:hypothetical protein IO424_001352 [Campylobacter fetus]|uniref:hypothetical protein n=1 Tax=Campylobacter fetus TaxID=196 RepID=UPI000508EBEF|nr:hypothetical protein [Campylobacter fetus]WKW16891.1 hypothetical protein IXZ25_06500 [Campylobacter fetus subsp. fetus]AIR79121.1 hypothetical protein CFF04554_1231 [Campylobacter fetus subsp. fetus 04/554]EAJ5692651.1 hypothetical protein [Campylobacter fetus]EAJ5704130.1 hypothetical protein [Campylobacter fetus]EAJ9257237.1 hypothetical protein [Campylobacter fetus]
MNSIAALDSGTPYHIVSLHKKPFNKFFSKVIYIPELQIDDLHDVDILIVTCASSIEKILEHKNIFYEFLKAGKTLVVMGRNDAGLWLHDVKLSKLPFNFWWWLDKKNNSIDIEVSNADYELFKYINFNDMIWHYHDGYEPMNGAISVIEHKIQKKTIFLDNKDYYGGRLILTSLDPFYHHGSFFMPNATKFAEAFLRYLSKMELYK